MEVSRLILQTLSLWEIIMLLLVLTSACAIGSYDYSDRKNETSKNKALDVVTCVLTAFFGLEALIKIIALGLVSHPKSYLRSPWNCLDFALLAILVTYCVPDLYVLRGLRIFLVLRVFKIAYTLTSMKKLLVPLMHALSELPKVIIFLVFILFIFSVIGVRQLSGDWYYRCRLTPEPIDGTWEIDETLNRPCSANGYGDYECPADRYCGHPDMYNLPVGINDMDNSASYLFGTANYNDIFKALVASFQIITFDSWADYMYKYQDTTNTYFARIFFPLLIFVGGFFSLNLVVAVIVDSFGLAKSEAKEEEGRSAVVVPKNDDLAGSRDSGITRRPSFKSWDEITVTPAETKKSGIRMMIKQMCEHAAFRIVVMLLIMANLIVLAFNRYNISDSERDLIDWLNTAFCSCFWLEMLIEFLGYGFSGYFADKYNVLDFIINIFGIIETALTYSSFGAEYKARVIIVILRTTRTVKLINKWKALGDMLGFIWNAITDIINFSVLLAIVVFMFAVIGMELFANEAKFNAENKLDLVNGVSDRIHYDDIGNALRSVFDLLVGDNWSTTFYVYSRANRTAAIIFFIAGTFAINIIMVNIFLALILQNFSEDEQKKKMEEEDKNNQEFLQAKKTRKSTMAVNGKSDKDGLESYRGLMTRYQHRERTLLSALKIFKRIIALEKEVKAKRKRERERLLVGRSFLIFDASNSLRQMLNEVVSAMAYQIVLYLVMFAYSILLSFHTPLYDPNGSLRQAINVIDIMTAAIFVLDILAKSIAFGFLTNGEKSYLRSGWNCIDLVLTIIQIVNMALPSEYILIHKILYMCSVLRGARIVTVSEGFLLCIQAIINGSFRIAQTLFIAMLFFTVFAIIGVQFFGGYLYYCDRTNVNANVQIVTIYDCINNGGEWRDRDVSFNNVFSAFLTLFELFSGKSLTSLYRFLPDISDMDYEPVKDSEPYYTLFIVAFMVFAFIFIRGIVTGVISDTFFKEKDILQGFKNLTPAQIKWARLAKIIFKAHPIKMYPRESKLYPLHRFFSHSVFHWIISAILVLNGVVLAFTWHGASQNIRDIHDIGIVVFIGIYVLEIALKILCYGKDYFRDGWNRFDLYMVICSGLCLIIELFSDLDKRPYCIFTTFFLVAKLLSLFHHAGVLRKMFQTFVLALSPIVNLALIFIVFLYIFDIAGVMLFAEVKLQTYLEKHANFQNLWYGFLEVFRLSTFDGWNDVMHDVMREETQYFQCVNYPTYDDIVRNGNEPNGCGHVYAAVFCVCVELIVTFIFLNLFIAIVVSSMMDITKLSESVLSDDKLEKFQRAWQKFDPNAEGYIEYSQIRCFLSKLGKPLGASETKMANRYYAAITLWMLDLKIYYRPSDGLHYLEFYDVLEALVKRTIYRAQTLDDIYNNPSRSRLLRGLESMSDQKTQLRFDLQPALQKVESLTQYYEQKNEKVNSQPYKKLKSLLPHLVYSTLKLTRTLKKQVKARKRANNLLPMVSIKAVHSECGPEDVPEIIRPITPSKKTTVIESQQTQPLKIVVTPAKGSGSKLIKTEATVKEVEKCDDSTERFLSKLQSNSLKAHAKSKKNLKPQRIHLKGDSTKSLMLAQESNAQEPNDSGSADPNACSSSKRLPVL